MITFTYFYNRIRKFGLEYFKKFYGSYRGVVHDNNDPDNLGRLQIFVKGIYAEPYEYWASPKGLYSGANKGAFFMPEIGDNVWVTFEMGEPKFPIWEYGFWNTDQVPEGASLTNKIIQTESGNKIEFDDAEKLIRITSAEGKVVEISNTISLGTIAESAEAAVLGETLKAKLDSLFDEFSNTLTAIQAITVTVAAFGTPSTPPLNSASFINIKANLDTLKGTLNEILSEIVTLD